MTKGLNPTNKTFVFFPNPSPILPSQHKGEVHNAILIPKLKRHIQPSPPAVSRSITGCFHKEI